MSERVIHKYLIVTSKHEKAMTAVCNINNFKQRLSSISEKLTTSTFFLVSKYGVFSGLIFYWGSINDGIERSSR